MQRLAVATAAALAVVAALALTHPSHSAPPAPKASAIPTPGLEVATFAGGCFWSMEYEFDKVEGVTPDGLRLHGRQDAEPHL